MKCHLYRVVWLGLCLLLLSCGQRGGVTVTDSWAEAGGGPNAAIYMIIRNDGNTADTLQSVASAACGSAEIHITSMDSQGVMRMAPLPGNNLLVPARSETALQVGGLHIMCLNKTDAFVPGATISLTLRFVGAGELITTVPVRP